MKLAIKGHATRGKEVIQLLEMLGGKSNSNMNGYNDDLYYFIAKDGLIYGSDIEYEELNCKYTIFTLEEFLEKFPYKVGDKVTLDNKLCSITWMCWECNNIYYQVQGIDTMFTKKVTTDDLQPYKEETNMKTDCKNCGLHYGSVRCFDMEHCPNNKPKSNAVGLKDGKVIECGVNMKDNKATGSRIDFSLTERIELDLGDTHEVVVENGKTYVVKKKPQYPKTYEECCEVLGISRHDVEIDLPQPYQQKMFNLFKLHICLDAYWKIAGEQMGLGKPWEPDWMDSDFKYCLKKMGYNIGKLNEKVISCILAFPTPEMRDAFYENFKDLIEECKELL